MPAARVAAHAKINLALRILAREASGFHDLETLFCRIALADDVVVRVGDATDRALTCTGEALPEEGLGAPEENLAWRAADAYAGYDNWPRGFTIEIEKRIPVGGGLGGGSADAGAVLRALNALNPRPLPPAELLAIAGTLGADVPFLTGDAPLALAWGRGDRMLALPALPERDVALVLPPHPVNTAEAYGWLAASRAALTAQPHRAVLHPLAAVTTWEGVARLSANDFEPVVFEQRPELAKIYERLAAVEGVAVARMSGSGSTLFALFEDELQLRAVTQATGCRALATATLAELPLVGVDLG
ncbi:MAG TPA: 4-(cytidine 5'-diphospho)-2-C-methyl-D-erythritol kinase [Gemmatimonadaceae bacterium]|nr:4-(cytidine 5'-diphospho)-2-C-methyl-D-erythritol kinase [Gemmatimonadaceae bacterium]